MSDDPELEAIRARLRAEIVAQAGVREAVATAPEGPIDVTTKTFETFVRTHPTVLVDLWAPWCGPCKTVAPVVDELARSLRGRLAVAKVNTDEEPELAKRLQVQSIPTLVMYRNGRLVDRLVGALPKAQLDAWVRRNVP